MTAGALWRRLAVDGLVVAVVCVFVLAVLAALPGALGADSWLALVGGREIAHSGIPHVDALAAWTHGRAWIDQQWLAQVTAYGLYALGGLVLLLLVHAFLAAAAVAVAAATARSTGAAPRAVAIVLAGALFSLLLGTWQFRSEAFAHVLFVAVVALLVLDSRGPSRRVSLTIPLLALWSNVHGSVVLGALLAMLRGVELVAAGRGDRRLVGRGAVLLCGAPLCLLATPYGVSVLPYYRRTLLDSHFGRLIVEWQPPHLGPLTVGFFAVAAAGIWLIGREGRVLTRFERAAFWITLAGALLSMRSIIWFTLVALIVLPRALTAVHERKAPGVTRPRINVALGAVALAATFAAAAVVGSRPSARYANDYPAAAAAAVSASVASDQRLRVLADERFADWLLWTKPQLRGRLAYDVRFELLTDRELDRILRWHEQATGAWGAAADCCRLLVLDRTRKPDPERPYLAAGARRIFGDHRVSVLVLPEPAE